MRDFKGCLTGQVDSYLSPRDSPPPPVSLTQVADCMSDRIAAPYRLGVTLRGVFISQKHCRQFASISANFAACNLHQKHAQCIDPAQSFGRGHVIAHAAYVYQYEVRHEKNARSTATTFFYAVLLPFRGPA